jgi:hypothetical protein
MEKQLDWALAACARVMRPVVRLAVAMGIKHQHLSPLLHDLLLEEARRSWRLKGVEPNISQLSVTTGLNRKAVTSKVRAPDDVLPQTERSAAARTLTAWLQLAADRPEHRSLPIVAEHGTLSFETMARAASRGNVHHRAILDELVRLKMAGENNGFVELSAEGFVPVEDLQSMLAFLGDNVRDHLLAAVSNTLGEGPPMLERVVYASGLTLQDCDRIQKLVRQRWRALHHELTDELTRALAAAAGTGTARIRIGVYAYHEDTESGSTPAQAEVSTSSKRKS